MAVRSMRSCSRRAAVLCRTFSAPCFSVGGLRFHGQMVVTRASLPSGRWQCEVGTGRIRPIPYCERESGVSRPAWAPYAAASWGPLRRRLLATGERPRTVATVAAQCGAWH